MNTLVTLVNEQPVTSSLQVAEVFEKEHKNVIKDIRGLSEEITKAQILALDTNVVKPTFIEDTYQTEGNFKKYPMFYMNKDAWTMLVMGYTGKKAIKFKLEYIAQFNKMEKQMQVSLPQNYTEALRQLADKVEENERLKAQLKQQDFSEGINAQLETKAFYTTEEIAYELGYKSARALNKALHEAKIVYPRGNRWFLYYPHRNKNWKDTSSLQLSQKWTEEGRKYIVKNFKKMN